MDRRKFLTWVGVGALASSLPVAIAACQPQSPQSDMAEPTDGSASVGEARDDGGIVVGTVDELDAQGYLVSNPSFASGSIIVVRDPGNADTLYAVDSFCTHQGCSVEWDADELGFVCPCHQSAFALDGRVMSGPATEALATFNAQIDVNDVIVQPG